MLVGTPFDSPTLAADDILITVHQGEVALVTLPVEDGALSVAGQFQDQAIPFFKNGSDAYTALIGADLALSPGEYPLTVTIGSGKEKVKKEYPVEVLLTEFGVERLTLPKDKVDLTPQTAAREYLLPCEDFSLVH